MTFSFSHLFSDTKNEIIHDPTEVGVVVSEDTQRPVLYGRDIHKLRADMRRGHEDAFTQHCSRCRFY